MTPRRSSVGEYGNTVGIERRNGRFYLRWWDSSKRNGAGGFVRRSLRHSDEKRAKTQARELAVELQAAQRTPKSDVPTVHELFFRYERDVLDAGVLKTPGPPRRRLKLWRTFLGSEREIRSIDRPTIDRFVAARRAGAFEGFRKDVTGRTVGADVELLRTVLNWGTTVTVPGGQRLLDVNPIHGYPIPKTSSPKRPVVTYDRFLVLRPHCEVAHPMFGVFMDVVESTGWRVSAICQLRADDLDRAKRPEAPNGRLRKRRATDKQGVDGWVPITASLRSSLDTAPVVGAGYLFPAPSDPTRPWTRHYARQRLRLAEKLAKLEKMDGGDFHPYRRKWATERKHLPDADVAAAGGWLDTRSLKTAYQQVDPETLLAVVSEPRKLREVR